MFFNMFKKSNSEGYKEKIKELLSCSEDDAKEIDDIIRKMIPGKITEIVREDDNVGIVLYVYNSAGDKYIVDVTRDLIVEDIYKNDRNGERIYFIMF